MLRGDAAKEHLGRSAEKDHGVELRVELSLVRDRARDVERRSLFACQKLGDAILAPHVAAVGIRPLTPAPVVRVDDRKAALLELCDAADLPRRTFP